MKTFTDTPLWNAKNNQRMWKMYLENCTVQQEELAVPLKNHLPEILPPTYLETAEFDCLHDEAILYGGKIKNRTKELQINETKGTFHGYDMLSKHPISKDSLEKRIAFMKKWMDKL